MILNFYFQNDFFTKETLLSFAKTPQAQNSMKTHLYKDVNEDGDISDVELYKSLLLVGDNGAGKTNLLNAIKFCLLVIEDNLPDKDQLFVEQYMANNNYKYKIDFIYKNKIATVSYTSFKNENRCSMKMEIDNKSCTHLIPANGLYNLSIRDDFNLDLINNIKNINNSLILNDCRDGNIHFLRLMDALEHIDDGTSNQLIFATHNPQWLDNNKYFSEEQIYFIDPQDKDLVYALSYFDLTEINKKSLNYRDAYLRGRFSAVPDLD